MWVFFFPILKLVRDRSKETLKKLSFFSFGGGGGGGTIKEDFLHTHFEVAEHILNIADSI